MPAAVQMKRPKAKLLDEHIGKFMTLIDSSPVLYLKGTCLDILAAFEEDEGGSIQSSLACLRQQIATFERLHRNICTDESKLLELGLQAADDMSKLKDITLQVSHVISCLEDLWVATSEGYQVLQTGYQNRTLLYQA